jgi:hypothetical protein
MALITCPECGKQISDKAVSCPECGFPLADYLKQSSESKEGQVPSSDSETIFYDPEDNIDLNCGKNRHIKIENGYMTVITPFSAEIRDRLDHFVLEYFGISMGINIGLLITNKEKRFTSGIIDVVASKHQISDFQRFKSIMEKYDLFSDRSRFSVLYKKTQEEKELSQEKYDALKQQFNISDSPKHKIQSDYRKGGLLTKVKCPRCWSVEFEIIDTKKKFSVGKAAWGSMIGGAVLGEYGAIAGTFQGVDGKSGKTKFICCHCGKVWKQKV